MTVLVLPPRGIIEDWFPDLNKEPDGSAVHPRYYRWIDRKEATRLDEINEIDLKKVILWDPKPPEGSSHGIYSFQHRLEAESQDKIPLGLQFAEVMKDRPWPKQWYGYSFIGCLGTMVTITRRTNRDAPIYPRLEVNRYEPTANAVMRWWSVERKPAKNMRVAFYPIETKS